MRVLRRVSVFLGRVRRVGVERVPISSESSAHGSVDAEKAGGRRVYSGNCLSTRGSESGSVLQRLRASLQVESKSKKRNTRICEEIVPPIGPSTRGSGKAIDQVEEHRPIEEIPRGSSGCHCDCHERIY